jgi:O-acetyl-ADP-ribose deacetylase (regulator of RNase III)
MQGAVHRSTPTFETLFVDENPDVVNALAKAFGRTWSDAVRCVVGNMFQNGPGVIVSPTNSEAELSAGLDLQLKTKFHGLEQGLHEYVRTLPSKRLKIETAVCFRTQDADFPLVIFSPVFRTPSDLATANRVYRAALAVFRSAKSMSVTPRLLMPGFGTGVGGFDPEVVARRMFQAYCKALQEPIDRDNQPEFINPRPS